MNDIPPIAPLPPLAPLPRDQQAIDLDHLNLLSIFYFVEAGLSVFGIFFLMVHFTIMHAVFTNSAFWQGQKQGPPPFEIFDYLIWFYLAMGLVCIASAILNLLAGIFLRARKYRNFSFVVAAINCLQIPLGTILGIFTIIVLTRESVRQLYEVEDRRYI